MNLIGIGPQSIQHLVSHILKTLIVQYIIKMSSVPEYEAQCLRNKIIFIYNALEEGIALLAFYKLTILNNSTVWVNVAESGQTGDPDWKR